MPSFEDVMEYEKEATHHLEKLSQNRIKDDVFPFEGIEAIVHAILAVGVRIDYSISQFNRKEWPNRNA